MAALSHDDLEGDMVITGNPSGIDVEIIQHSRHPPTKDPGRAHAFHSANAFCGALVMLLVQLVDTWFSCMNCV